MAKFQIFFAPIAARQFCDLTKVVQLRITAAIGKLADAPLLGKPLKGELHEYRSYRVGDYRVVYHVRSVEVRIDIVRVAHRKEVYR